MLSNLNICFINDLLRNYLSNRKQLNYVLGEKFAIEICTWTIIVSLFLLYVSVNCFTDNDII